MESNPSTDEGTNSSSSENPFSDRHNRPSRSFSLRSSRESTRDEKAEGADFRQEAPPVPGQTTGTHITTKTHLQPNQYGIGQDHLSRTTSPTASNSSSPEEEWEAILESLPPLSVNETAASIAAEAIDPELIKKGKNKVARHKYFAIFIIFTLK